MMKSASLHTEMVFSRILYGSATDKQGNILEIIAALVAEGRMKPIATTRLDGLSAETMKTAHELVETKTDHRQSRDRDLIGESLISLG